MSAMQKRVNITSSLDFHVYRRFMMIAKKKNERQKLPGITASEVCDTKLILSTQLRKIYCIF